MKFFDAAAILQGSPDVLLRLMDRHGIARALVHGAEEGFPPRLVPCPVIRNTVPASAKAVRATSLPEERLLQALENRRIPLFLDLDPAMRTSLESGLKRHPDLPWVLTRVGYRNLPWLHELCARRANLHLELSWFFRYGGLEELVEKFGPDRWLFGTTMPERDPGAAIGMVRYARIPEKARRKIAGENLERLLR